VTLGRRLTAEAVGTALLLAGVVGSAIYNGALAIATFPLLRGVFRTTEKQASFGW